MIYIEKDNIVCRQAISKDLSTMYDILEPMVVRPTDTDSIKDMHRRKLKKYLSYGIKKGYAVIVEEDTDIKSCYLGSGNDIVSFASKEVNPKVSILLAYVVLCQLHNRYANSNFIFLNEEHKNVFNFNSKIGKTVIVEDLKCIITVDTKNLLEKYYNKIF
jgi:hypothetical protein